MRPLWKDILAAVWIGMILPGTVLNAFVWKENQLELQQLPQLQVQIIPESGQSILVQNTDGTCTNMDLDTYLTGVLLAEIPAGFHEEAIKAQSVAARTYAWKAHSTGGKHGDSSVCTEASCCQAYIGEDAYLSRGGNRDDLDKVRKLVQATSGMVLLYDGEPIEATYFSSSGGSTEAAVAVWGSDYPYLQAVSSPEECLADSVTFSVEEFQNTLEKHFPGDPEEWFGSVEYTEGGGVATMQICGEIYTGVELRSLLALRSTDFQVHTEDDTIVITTNGYGHRVGMSQYGAHTMAKNGSNYQKILQHYYPGTNLVPIPQHYPLTTEG